jgi:hypothetical protein
LCATFIPGFWAMNKFVNSIVSVLTFKRKAQ